MTDASWLPVSFGRRTSATRQPRWLTVPVNGAAPTTLPVTRTAVASKPALPSGTACAEAINRYDTVVTSDVETGNVNKPVYESIQRDLAPARSACIAGRGGEAIGMVSASRRRHGYPG